MYERWNVGRTSWEKCVIKESGGEDGVLFFIRIKLHIRETNFCNFKLATIIC